MSAAQLRLLPIHAAEAPEAEPAAEAVAEAARAASHGAEQVGQVAAVPETELEEAAPARAAVEATQPRLSDELALLAP